MARLHLALKFVSHCAFVPSLVGDDAFILSHGSHRRSSLSYSPSPRIVLKMPDAEKKVEEVPFFVLLAKLGFADTLNAIENTQQRKLY